MMPIKTVSSFLFQRGRSVLSLRRRGRFSHVLFSSGKNTKDDSLEYVSHFKSPIVQKLWEARREAKVQASKTVPTVHEGLPRVPNQSMISISYPFSRDELLKESYRNPWGQLRFGKILEDLDALAGNIAFAHVKDPNLTIVTASVDRIILSSIPNLEKDLELSGKVTYVGTSSMEIKMQCKSVGNDNKYWMEAYFTFVATDPITKRPLKITPLKPETELEKQQFQSGKQRAAAKKKARQQAKNHQQGLAIENEMEENARDLLQQAWPVLNMPSLACPDSILLSQTELTNCEIAQPQTRNLASQIFGGFLMRRACELAYSTVWVFGGARPTFFEVDQVSFGMPVNVGDLLKFKSRVLYAQTEEGPLRDFKGMTKTVSVEVEAWVLDPVDSSATLANQFYFTFALPSETFLRRVLPANMEESRKILLRMTIDKARNEEEIEL